MDLDRVLDDLLADDHPPPDTWSVPDIVEAAQARGESMTYDRAKQCVRRAVDNGRAVAVGRYVRRRPGSPSRLVTYYRSVVDQPVA